MRRGLSQDPALQVHGAGVVVRPVDGRYLARVPVGDVRGAHDVGARPRRERDGPRQVPLELAGSSQRCFVGDGLPWRLGGGCSYYTRRALLLLLLLFLLLAGQLSNLGEDVDTAGGEAHDAVDLVVVLGGVDFVIQNPGRRDVALAAAREAAQDVEVGEPAPEEVAHLDLVMLGGSGAAADGAGPAQPSRPGRDEVSGQGQVALPWYGVPEGRRGYDLDRREHDGRRDVCV